MDKKKRVVAGFIKHPKLIDYIQDYSTHKKHLILIYDKESESYEIAQNVAQQLNVSYPYDKERKVPSIPKIISGTKIKKGETVYKQENAFKSCVQYDRCVILNNLHKESYSALEAVTPQLMSGELFFIATLKSVKDLVSIPQSFLHFFMFFDLEVGKFLSQEVEDKKIDSDKNDYEFSLEGEIWKISYEGESKSFKNNKGLQYIYCLLGNSGDEISALELVREINKSPGPRNADYKNMNEDQLERQLMEDDLSIGSKDTLLDKEAIAAYRKYYSKLKDELEDETTSKCKEEKDDIEKEMEKVIKVLTAGCDKNGEPRKIADEAEKARKAIRKAIKESLDKIKDDKNGHPVLWKHFKSTLTTGKFCSYKSEKYIPWKL